MRTKGHSPIRSCVGCGARDSQEALLRFRWLSEGNLRLVSKRESSGRSGYLHRNEKCWSRFVARKGSVRSLGRNVSREVRKAFVDALAPSSLHGGN